MPPVVVGAEAPGQEQQCEEEEDGLFRLLARDRDHRDESRQHDQRRRERDDRLQREANGRNDRQWNEQRAVVASRDRHLHDDADAYDECDRVVSEPATVRLPKLDDAIHEGTVANGVARGVVRRDEIGSSARTTPAAATRGGLVPPDDTMFTLPTEPKSSARATNCTLRRPRIVRQIANPNPKEQEMISKGDVLHNPVTGELMRFVETSADTGGEYVLIEVVVEPGGVVAAAHVHPYQTERFEVLEGEVGFKTDGGEIVATAGEKVVVPAGAKHKFWNAGDTDAVFRCEIRPALQFEQLIETMFTLAADGKTNKKGMPNPLRLAVIANAHFDDVRLPFPPAWMQKVGLAMGAPIGALLGYKPTYQPTAPSEAELAI